MTPYVSRRVAGTAAALAAVVGLVACGGSSDDVAEPEVALDGSPAADLRDPARRGPQGDVAQFVVECELSHLAYDDPIVLPWQPGQSHLHQFFGNNDVTDDPTYGDLLSAETSCKQRRDTASYWAPALLDATGNVIEPLKMTAYYRPGPSVDPAIVEPYPEGLMMVAGDSTSEAEQPTSVIAWSCGTGLLRESTPPDCTDSSVLAAGATISGDSTLRLLVTFPDCWDGDRLTTFGAAAHVRYSTEGACPESHATPIPQLLMAIEFPAVDPTDLSLASGAIETAHADFWNVWDQDKLEGEVANCLNRDLVCGVVG